MRSPSVITSAPSDRLRLLPWALVLVLLVAQFSAGAHKVTLDGHEAGQLCHACVLFDRDDAPPSDSVSAVAALQRCGALPLLPETQPAADSCRRVPPPRAPPLFHA